MEPVSSVLFSIFRGTPQHDEWIVSCLEGSWPRLLGEKLSGVCRPGRCEGSHLTIHILDPEWSETVSSLHEEILAKLRDATGGEIRSLAFKRIDRITGS